MFLNGKINSFNEIVEVGASLTTGTPGVQVTPGYSGALGSWTAWATPTNDVYGIQLSVGFGALIGVATNQSFDIGIDPAGGTSYTVLMQDILCGYTAGLSPVTQWHYFPIFLKGGTSIAIRARSSHTTGTIRFYGQLCCKPTNPETLFYGSYCETLGFTGGATVAGTAFTPNSSASATWTNNWVSLGTTTRNLKYWQVYVQANNAVTGAMMMANELAYGDGTDFTRILVAYNTGPANTSEQRTTQLMASPVSYCDVPAGSTIYVRGVFTGSNVTGQSAVALGIGG